MTNTFDIKSFKTFLDSHAPNREEYDLLADYNGLMGRYERSGYSDFLIDYADDKDKTLLSVIDRSGKSLMYFTVMQDGDNVFTLLEDTLYLMERLVSDYLQLQEIVSDTISENLQELVLHEE